ncbi:MAG TPA: HdeA/HdeB family chaperone [Xanthobacteraceae bacterium]|nr:HdeA/HdeB family chaperone [Xanthobacteraceae bacterium]
MFRVVKCALAGATLSLFAVAPASAEAIDVSTITCGEMIESVTGAFPKNPDKAAPANPSQERAAQKMGVIMIWLHGYNASEDRGTVLDYAQVKSYAEELGAFCALNPKIGLMTAAKKYSGDNAPKPSRDAVDVSTIKCSALKDGANEKLSVAIIWLGGWQAGVDDESTFDFEEFGEDITKFAEFCAKNPSKGFVTAAKDVFGN